MRSEAKSCSTPAVCALVFHPHSRYRAGMAWFDYARRGEKGIRACGHAGKRTDDGPATGLNVVSKLCGVVSDFEQAFSLVRIPGEERQRAQG